MSKDLLPVVKDSNFDTFVEQAPLPVLLDFYAPWCGPCKQLLPAVEAMAKEFETQLIVGKLNVDDNQQIPRRFGVQSIPTLLLFKNGIVMEAIVGPIAKSDLKKQIEKHLG